MKYFFAIFLIILFPTIISAQKYYIGIDHTFIDYSDSGGYEADLQMLNARYGILIHKNLAFEMRFGRGIKSDTIKFMGTNIHMRLGNTCGFYLLGILPIANIFRIYTPVGFSDGSATVNAFNVSITKTETDFSYGIGIELISNKKGSFVLEYMKYIDKPDFEYSGLGSGFRIYF